MTNADEFSELIRTGNLDFALLKPIDTQFLVSLQRIDWSSLGEFPLRRWRCWSIRWCRLDYLPGPGAVRALSAVCCSAAWRFSTA